MCQESQPIEPEGLRRVSVRDTDGNLEFVLVDREGRVQVVPVRMQARAVARQRDAA